VDSEYTHTGIDKQLVKKERIQTKPIDRLFEIFNIDTTKKLKINKHKKQINIAVMDLNGIDMFLGYDWLVKHNPEVN